MFAQEFNKFCQTAFFVVAQMILNVPRKIILPKIAIKLRSRRDNIIQCIESKTFFFLLFDAEADVINSASQRPDRIDKRKLRQIKPRFAQIPNRVFMRRAEKINRRIADE